MDVKMTERTPMEPKQVDPEKMVVCSVCGWLVRDEEIAREGEALMADYDTRHFIKWHLVICRHCSLAMDEIDKLGAEGAVMRMGLAGRENV